MHPFTREARSITRLAVPVVATQLGGMMLLVVDHLMLGHYTVSAFAAAGIARVWVMGTALLGQGLLFGLDPIVSQAHGARDAARLGSALQRGLLLALLLSLPIGGLWFATERVLVLFGQEPELAAIAQRYALAQLPGLPFFFGFMALRAWLQGRRVVRPTMWIVLLANLVHAPLDWLLIFGVGPLPELGVVGAGTATACTQAAMFFGLLAVVRGFRLERGGWKGWEGLARTLRGSVEVLRFGGPVALQIGLEMWAFQISTLWAGTFGAISLASHQIAMNLASLSFMVPLGVAMGASTRVGNLIGAGRRGEAQLAAWVALAMGAGVMTFFAVVFVVARDALPALYGSNPEVISLASTILPIAAAFQLFDGTQVVGSGVLRGMGSTRIAALAHLIGFYGIGLPLARVLTFNFDLGLRGVWWGLCAGLGAVSIALVAWIAVRGPAHPRAVRASGAVERP